MNRPGETGMRFHGVNKDARNEKKNTKLSMGHGFYG